MLNLHGLVFWECAINHLTAKSLRIFLLKWLAHKEWVTHLLESLILEMLTEVKQLDFTLLKTHDHISIDLEQAGFILLELNVVLTTLCSQVYVWYLSRTEWLYLVNDHIEPD